MKKVWIIGFIILLYGQVSQAYRVYLHTGYGNLYVNRMWDGTTIENLQNRDTNDGNYLVGFSYNSREYSWDEPFINAHGAFVGTDRPTIYEMPPYSRDGVGADWFTAPAATAFFPAYYDVYHYTNPQFIMWYREDGGREGSYIRASDVANLKAIVNKNYGPAISNAIRPIKWLTHTRHWSQGFQDSVDLPEVGGANLEFGIPWISTVYFDTHIVPAIKYTLAQNKWVFLLNPPLAYQGMPPGKISQNNNTYVDQYFVMIGRLKLKLTDQEFNSNKLVLVPANYKYGQHGVKLLVTPELTATGEYANTMTGAALVALRAREAYRLGNR